jgi:hypothetical protein
LNFLFIKNVIMVYYATIDSMWFKSTFYGVRVLIRVIKIYRICFLRCRHKFCFIVCGRIRHTDLPVYEVMWVHIFVGYNDLRKNIIQVQFVVVELTVLQKFTKVIGFLRVLRFPPAIKLTSTILLKCWWMWL